MSLPEATAAPENDLARAASAYLRSARHQPVQWQQWSEDAFAQAARENKPVLLDIGAVWCHWCHVMDRESYENPETADIINRHFIAIKVDRDERPDVDTRYQTAVSTISGQGGWPLTAFLTPAGKPFFGGTYFPPEDRSGRAGFPRVLLTMAGAFADKRDEVEESAASILEALEVNESFDASQGELGRPLLERIVEACTRTFDPRHGGFGSQPKFPHSGALDLLLDAATRGGEDAAEAARIATVSLDKMAAGGIHDQLAGGFHRYSVDERWIVPHFEKMAYDNSELLKNYVHAFQSFAQPPFLQTQFAQTARGILRWMDECLSDRERGGFYASQDADDSLDDDGDFFTWTRAEARAVLSAEEFRVAALRFNLRDVGDMHHNPQKNVLHLGASPDEIAQQLALDAEEVRALLQTAEAKLYAARLQRRTPFVDRTVYSGWNGMCISAYLAAARVLQLHETGAFALKSLDRMLAVSFADAGGMEWGHAGALPHVIAYGESEGTPALLPGVLEDYAFVANAALDAWEYSGQLRFFQFAQRLADEMIARFYDQDQGGFFDTEQMPGSPQALGVLSVRRKPMQDSPTPSGNAVAATVLLRLYELTNRDDLRVKALATLQCFAGVAEHFGLYAASYALALRRALAPPVQVCILGDDEAVRELELAANVRYAVNKSVVRIRPEAQLAAMLPPALAETLPGVPVGQGALAILCQGNTCQPPVRTPEALLDALAGLERAAAAITA